MLQGHVEHLRAQVEAIEAWPQKMAAINRHLFEEARLRRRQRALLRPAQQLPAFRRTSTPDDEEFRRFRARKRGSIQRFESGHLVRRFEPLRRFTDDPVAGPRIMHIRMTCRYTSAKIFFVMA